MDLQGSREEKKGAAKSRVKVAIRVRPMVAREKMENESSCIEFKSESQIVIGGDRSYKFDRVFSEESPQRDVFEHCIKELVLNCFDGYNAAVLAYGQTGSGKTFTMGTSISTLYEENTAGIIPRVIKEIFQQVEQRRQKAQFVIKASFLQIYNEQIIDLLADAQLKNIKNKDLGITIREEKDGSVSIYGVNEEKVSNADQMVKLLEKGGFNRTTASTLMNEASSRSHAIFTIFIEQHIIEDLYKSEGAKKDAAEEGFMTAKFFFVDLAGSERAKKTGATGATLREGININLGLLELGNVISALATIDKKHDQFITFRNSKLTRILQDCLGGNSNTYMIACVSPAESNFEESLNTLKYASKAMNIKNTPVINRDPQSALISQLRQRIFELEVENRKYKQMLNSKGVTIEEEGDNSDEMTLELKKIKDENKSLQRKLAEMAGELQVEKHRLYEQEIKMYEIRREKDIMQISFEEMLKENPQLNQSEASQSLKERFMENEREKISVLDKHLQHIQVLEMRVVDRDNLFKQLQLEYDSLLQNSKKDEKILIKKNNLLYSIGRENAKLKKELAKYNHPEETELNMSKTLNGSVDNTKMHEEMEEILIMQNAEIFEQDEEIQEHEEDYTKREQKTQEEMNKMDEYILEKEQFLEKMSKELINQETELISSMKNEYHEKIRLLEKERKNLMKQKDESGVFEKNKFVNKIENLENELKDYRKKAKDQKNMEKLVENQNNRIKDLAEQIKKFKVQKMELSRKMKEEKDIFNNLKSKRIKELLNAKKETLKKDNQIRKLTLDNFKKNQLNKKKDDEIKRIKRANQTLKSIIKPISRRESGIAASALPASSSLTNSMNLAHSAHGHQQDAKITEREQQDYLSYIIKVILVEIDREQSMGKYQLKMQQSERELDLLLNDDSTFKLKLERIKLKEEDELTEEDISMREELELNLNDLRERITICEDSINFCKSKYSSIINQHNEYFDIDSFILYHKNYDSLDRLKCLVKATFNCLKNLLFENYKIVNEREQRQLQIRSLKDQVGELREQIMNMNTEYHRNLVQMREEMMINRLDNSIEETELAPINSNKRYEEKEKRELEKKIQDLTKTNRQVTAQLEKTRRKCEVVQEKYQNIKNLVSKDKNIGRQGPDEVGGFVKPDNTKRPAQKPITNKVMIEELDGMLDSFDKLKKVRSYTALEDHGERHVEREAVREERVVNEGEQTVNRWECVTKIEAHSSSILSIAVHSNFLISTATKSLKIWDLQNKKVIAELSGSNLAGSVKFAMIDPNRRLFFTACEKAITIWDLITLQIQGTLKCHKDEVRTIHSSGDYLFTGGKGSNNGGSLLVWDLRKLNPNQALQEKEKNQDIFTFTSKENTLFYGTRNHSVRRMNISNLDILSPFEPPHMDSVTGLTIVKNKLISGSKDKNLRLWSLDHSINNAKHTLHAFNDYVNTVQSPPGHSIFYAGSKDGQVKVCYTKNDRIEVLGGILAHTQSVNSLCSLDENPYGLISASQDRTIKIWQPTKETVENMGRQDYF